MTEDLSDPKTALLGYLRRSHDALLWKLDGLGERDARMPRTPTGTNLAGLVRHGAAGEIGYFGPVFGRAWPEPDDPCYVDWEKTSDAQADLYLPVEVGLADLADFYGRAWAFAEETIEELPLDAVGRVPWWGEDGETTLHRLLVHMTVELARHAGHADILREGIDGASGLRAGVSNLPDAVDWPAYVAKLTAIAESFPEG